ncbi:MAG: response regulator transcription factor [Verrucomicrobiota bacterium]|nr:response regulator transcription factor [Verrucomicrobiota bacterium]
MFEPADQKILLLCDHWLVCLGLKRLLEQASGFTVCATAEDSARAREMIADQAPDLMVIDLSGKNADAVPLVQALHSKFPDLPLLAVSAHGEPSSIQDTLAAGAAEYVVKRDVPDDLVPAVRRVLVGKRYAQSAAEVKADRRVTGLRRRALHESKPRWSMK